MIMGTDYWAGIELRHLLALQAVADTGSFHAAADRLDYTQSAVSQHIAALETIVGARLVERSRGRRTVSLTEAGDLLVRHTEAIVARLQAAHADLVAHADGTAGTLRVGTFQSVGARVLPTIVGRFAQSWPGVEVRLVEGNDEDALLRLVERGELDLAFATFPLPPGPFEALEVLRDPYVLMVPAGSALAASGAPPTLADIAAEPLIGFRVCRSTEAIESTMRRSGLEPRFVFRTDDNGTVRGLVAAGMGIALVPSLASDPADPSVTVLPTDLPQRVVALAWHRDRYRSPASRSFAELARTVCAELDPTARHAVA